MVPEDFKRWYVRNAQGNMVSVASFANSHWEYGSPRLQRYNGVAAIDINGEAAARREFRRGHARRSRDWWHSCLPDLLD